MTAPPPGGTMPLKDYERVNRAIDGFEREHRRYMKLLEKLAALERQMREASSPANRLWIWADQIDMLLQDHL